MVGPEVRAPSPAGLVLLALSPHRRFPPAVLRTGCRHPFRRVFGVPPDPRLECHGTFRVHGCFVVLRGPCQAAIATVGERRAEESEEPCRG